MIQNAGINAKNIGYVQRRSDPRSLCSNPTVYKIIETAQVSDIRTIVQRRCILLTPNTLFFTDVLFTLKNDTTPIFSKPMMFGLDLNQLLRRTVMRLNKK